MRRNDGGDEPVDMGRCALVQKSEKAMLVQSSAGREHWIPFGAVHDDSELYGVDEQGSKQINGTRATLILKRWFARKKGWSD